MFNFAWAAAWYFLQGGNFSGRPVWNKYIKMIAT